MKTRNKETEDLIQVLKTFCERVEKGELRSVRTYTMFKEYLTRYDYYEGQKIKVYELDFGDQNLLSTNIQDILSWIESDMSGMKEEQNGDDSLQYEITTKLMTQKEIDDLPEWGS